MGTERALGSLVWDQLEPGRLSARSLMIDAAPLQITRHDFNLGISMAADVTPGTCVFELTAAPISNARWFGSRVDEASIGESVGSLALVTRGRSSFYTLCVDERALGGELRASLKNVQLVKDPVSTRRLRRLLDRFFEGAATVRDLPESALSLLADAMRPTHWIRSSKCQARRLIAVRECELFMREHAHTTINLHDLSDAVGMEPRRLINAFQAITGCSPMSYLKRIRLNGARRSLQNAAEDRTIAQVATEWGFWHLGHFAADYRAMFGESPSQTLALRLEATLH